MTNLMRELRMRELRRELMRELRRELRNQPCPVPQSHAFHFFMGSGRRTRIVFD